MTSQDNTIIFALVNLKKSIGYIFIRTEYHILMVLIADCLLLPGFGLCSSMGICGTCMVEIKENTLPISGTPYLVMFR